MTSAALDKVRDALAAVETVTGVDLIPVREAVETLDQEIFSYDIRIVGIVSMLDSMHTRVKNLEALLTAGGSIQ